MKYEDNKTLWGHKTYTLDFYYRNCGKLQTRGACNSIILKQILFPPYTEEYH